MKTPQAVPGANRDHHLGRVGAYVLAIGVGAAIAAAPPAYADADAAGSVDAATSGQRGGSDRVATTSARAGSPTTVRRGSGSPRPGASINAAPTDRTVGIPSAKRNDVPRDGHTSPLTPAPTNSVAHHSESVPLTAVAPSIGTVKPAAATAATSPT